MSADLPMISIIVPVYNAEKYLGRCVESIRQQTYPNIEILLVDDGSTDGSGLLCDRMAAEDPRIRVFHQKNRGQAAARNTGLFHARGALIGFADNDDVLEHNMYEVMYHNKVRENACISGVIADWIYEKTVECPGKRYQSRIYSGEELMENMLLKKGLIYSSVWDKLFDRELFHNVEFPEGCEFEDYWVLSRILPQTERIYVDTVPLYHWFQYKTSRSKGGYDDKSKTYIDIPRKILDSYIKMGADEKLIRASGHFLVLGYIKYFGKVFMSDALKKERATVAVYQKELRILLRNSRYYKVSLPVFLKAWLLSGKWISVYSVMWKMHKSRKDGQQYF